MDTTYMTQAEIDLYNSMFGEKCECCKEKFGPGELRKDYETGEMLCEDCEENSDEPVVVSFGYPRWYGNYVFEDRHEAEEFANLFDGEII